MHALDLEPQPRMTSIATADVLTLGELAGRPTRHRNSGTFSCVDCGGSVLRRPGSTKLRCVECDGLAAALRRRENKARKRLRALGLDPASVPVCEKIAS